MLLHLDLVHSFLLVFSIPCILYYILFFNFVFEGFLICRATSEVCKFLEKGFLFLFFSFLTGSCCRNDLITNEL